MKIIGLFCILFSTTAFAGVTLNKSTAEKRLTKWKAQYCDNTSKRKIASECKMKPSKK